ncbi:MAG: hypothetical protein AAGG81_03225 [Chlamydiota bacterium]
MSENRDNSWGVIPLFFIAFCNMLTYCLLRNICHEVQSISPMGSDTHMVLKFFLSPAINTIVAAILLYAAKRTSVYYIVQRTLLMITAFTSIFFFIITPIYLTSSDPASTFEISSFLTDVKAHGLYAILYLFFSLWPPLTLLLFYGYFNNIVTFSRACTLYPSISIFCLILSEFVMPDLTQSILTGTLQEKMFKVGMISLICLFTTIYCFYRTNLNAKEESGAIKRSLGPMFIICLALITITVGFTKHISVMTWDFSIQIKDSFPKAYWDLLGSFSALKHLSILVTVVLLGFLSAYLKQNKMNGWKNFCYLSTGLIALLISTTIFLNLISGSIGSYLVKGDTALFDKLLISVGGSYQVFIATVFYPTLLCLKHLVFVPIPLQDRFRLKIIIDLIFYKGGYFVAVLLQSSLTSLADFKTQLMLTLALCFITVLLIRIPCINYVSKKLQPTISPEKY